MPGLGRVISNRVMKRKRNARPGWGGGGGGSYHAKNF